MKPELQPDQFYFPPQILLILWYTSRQQPCREGCSGFLHSSCDSCCTSVWHIDVNVLVRGSASWCHEALVSHIRVPLDHRCSGNTESRWVVKPQEEGIAQSQRQDLFVADANKLRWRNLSQWQELGHLFDDGLCSTLLHVWRHKSSSPAHIAWLFFAAPYILHMLHSAIVESRPLAFF